MQGMPSLWNMSRFRGSSSKASLGSKPKAAQLGHRGPLEPRRLGVVAPVAHDEHVPPQPVVRQPGQGLGLHPQGAAREQDDAQVRRRAARAGGPPRPPAGPRRRRRRRRPSRAGPIPGSAGARPRRRARRRCRRPPPGPGSGPVTRQRQLGGTGRCGTGAALGHVCTRDRLGLNPRPGCAARQAPDLVDDALGRRAWWCRRGRGPRPRRAAAGA